MKRVLILLTLCCLWMQAAMAAGHTAVSIVSGDKVIPMETIDGEHYALTNYNDSWNFRTFREFKGGTTFLIAVDDGSGNTTTYGSQKAITVDTPVALVAADDATEMTLPAELFDTKGYLNDLATVTFTLSTKNLSASTMPEMEDATIVSTIPADGVMRRKIDRIAVTFDRDIFWNEYYITGLILPDGMPPMRVLGDEECFENVAEMHINGKTAWMPSRNVNIGHTSDTHCHEVDLWEMESYDMPLWWHFLLTREHKVVNIVNSERLTFTFDIPTLISSLNVVDAPTELEQGATAELKASFARVPGTEDESFNLLWSVSDESIATITDGNRLLALAEGDVTVKVETDEGSDLTDEFTLHVKAGAGIGAATDGNAPVSVVCDGLLLTIDGLAEGESARVHDITGNLLYSGCGTHVNLPAPGFYIVDTPAGVFKIAAK